MARRRLQIGEIGNVSVTKTPQGTYLARCRYRAQTGVISHAQATHRAKGRARDLCIAAATEKAQLGNSEINLDSPLSALTASYWRTEVERHREGQITSSTFENYRRHLDTVEKVTAGLTVREATATRLIQLVNTTAGDKRSVHNGMRRALVATFTHAIRIGVTNYNPATAIPRKTKKAEPVATFTDTDLEHIRAALQAWETGGTNAADARGGRPRAVYLTDLVTLLLATGLRRNEALGLRWEDVELQDDDRAVIHVIGQVATRKANPAKGISYLYWKEHTKTRAGQRSIVVGASTAAMLRRRKAANTHNHPWVFANAQGGLRSPHNTRNHMQKAMDAAGVELQATKLHTYRKTVLSRVEREYGIRTTAVLAGHASTAITEQAYVNRGREVPDTSDALEQLVKITATTTKTRA